MNNIRHILLTIMMALMSSLSAWAVSTVDKLYLSPTTLTPGETETQYVSLVILGNRRYSAYNLDVTIPEGVELAYDEGGEDVYFDNNCIIPYSKGNPKHQLAATYTAEDRNLRISCVSTTNAEFTSESGVVCYIGLVVSTYAKPGALSINLSGQALTTADGTQYDPADATDTNIAIGTAAKATLTVSAANKWSTCILPFATALPEGLKAYTCDSKDDDKQVFYLSDAASIEAYTPYILYSESGYTGTLTGDVNASQYPASGKVAAGYLTGAVKAQTTSDGYILQKLNGVVKFYLADPSKTYTIPAGRCWATPPTDSAQSYGFALEPTAVNGVAETTGNENEYKYDLNGIIIGAPKDGQMYIQNGKKIIK